MKKALSFILIVCMALTIVSCSDTETIGTISQANDSTTIVYMTIGDKPTNGQTEKVIAALNDILIDKINVKLDVYYISWTDYLQKYNNVLADDDMQIDLVGTSTDWLDAWKNVIDGNFYPLTKEMLQQYCPETYASVSADEWQSCMYNNEIYLIPENNYTQWTNHGFIYRGDWSHEAGFDKGIHSWEDMTTYFEYVISVYPDVIPWDADKSTVTTAYGYLVSYTDYVSILDINSVGLWGAYKDDLGTVVSPYYEGEAFEDFADLMYTWKKMGVFRSDDTKLDIGNDYTTSFYTGQSACLQHHTNMFIEDRKPNMDTAQPGSNPEFFWFGEERSNVVRTSILHGAMAISARSENPELALMTYELLRNDEECYRLINYGIEGEQYVLVDEDSYSRPEDYISDLDNFTLNYWWGRTDTLALTNASTDRKAYEKLINKYNRVAIDYPWEKIHFDMSEYDEQLSEINAVCDEYLPLICFAEYEGSPQEIVTEFRSKLKEAGIEEITEYIQGVMDSETK